MVSKRLLFAAIIVAELGSMAVAAARDGHNRRKLPASDHIIRDEPEATSETAKAQQGSAPVRYFPRAERGSVQVRFGSDPATK